MQVADSGAAHGSANPGTAEVVARFVEQHFGVVLALVLFVLLLITIVVAVIAYAAIKGKELTIGSLSISKSGRGPAPPGDAPADVTKTAERRARNGVVPAFLLKSADPLWTRYHNAPGYQLEEYDLKLVIHADYGVEVSRRAVFSALGAPLSMLALEFESDGAQVIGFSPLALRVRDGARADLPWFPALDSPTDKRILVLLDPPLQPDGSTRTVWVTYKWEGCCRALAEEGELDNNSVSVPRGLTTPVGRLKVRVALSLPGSFLVTIDGKETRLQHPGSDSECEVELWRLPPGVSVPILLERVRG